jgi:hypothetical protein
MNPLKLPMLKQCLCFLAFVVMLVPLGCSGSKASGSSGGTASADVTAVQPGSISAGSTNTTINVAGTGFSDGTLVTWNGLPLITTFVSNNSLTAVIPAQDLTSSGSFQIGVESVAGGEVVSSVPFLVTNPNSVRAPIIVSVSSNGTAGNADSTSPVMSATGRFIAFISNASNLVPAVGLPFANIFLRDSCLGAGVSCVPSTVAVSISVDGSSLGNGNSSASTESLSRIAISEDGRYVAFESDASNLVTDDSNEAGDIFLRDTCSAVTTCTPQTTKISVGTGSQESNGASTGTAISSTGRFVAFESSATNLVPGDTNDADDIFLRDTCLGAGDSCSPQTILVSLSTAGTRADGFSSEPSIDSTGRFVTFSSQATNLIDGQTIQRSSVYVRDTCVNVSGCQPQTLLVSSGINGQAANGGSSSSSINGEGQYVVFSSDASNLTNSKTVDALDVYLTAICNNTNSCVPNTIRVENINGGSGAYENSAPGISDDARVVVFLSEPVVGLASAGTTEAVATTTCLIQLSPCTPSSAILSATSSGLPANHNVGSAAISGDGKQVAYSSGATNLVAVDTAGHVQIYAVATLF